MAKWLRLWVIPKVAGFSIPGAQWVDVGWVYMNPIQQLMLQEMFVCSHVFDRAALIDLQGDMVWHAECLQKQPS